MTKRETRSGIVLPVFPEIAAAASRNGLDLARLRQFNTLELPNHDTRARPLQIHLWKCADARFDGPRKHVSNHLPSGAPIGLRGQDAI